MNPKEPIVILASGSPRRKQLLELLAIPFLVNPSHIEEKYPENLQGPAISTFLAEKKFQAALAMNPNADLVISADTIVWFNGREFAKPAHPAEAEFMLEELSGKTHEVFTTVCFGFQNSHESLTEVSKVTFNHLNKILIREYINTCKPFDKAGSYGAQETISPIINPCNPAEIEFLNEIKQTSLPKEILNSGLFFPMVNSISGSFFNVMGFPVHRLNKPIKILYNDLSLTLRKKDA